MVDIIAPADAFRLMLSARYGKTTLKLAEKINHPAWFTYRKSSGIPTSVQEAAVSALEMLRRHIKEGDIRLRGELKASDPPSDIDRADCLVGELKVFEQKLIIYAHGLTKARTYERVFCVKADVLKIVDRISKNRSGLKSKPELKSATDTVIRNAITSVYDAADKGGPRPNINQLPNVVQPRLKALGYEAAGHQIKKIGKEFASRRGRVGKRLT